MSIGIFLLIVLNSLVAGLNFTLALDNYKNNRICWLPMNIGFGIANIAAILILLAT